MAVPYYNQTITGYSTTSVSSLTTSSVTTYGNFFVAIVSFRTSTGGSVSSFSDSKGNKWTPLVGSPKSSTPPDETAAAYFSQNATSGTLHTFTVTLTGASAPSITVIEFKDVASYASVDYQSYYADATATTTHTLPTTPTLSPGFSVMVVADDGADSVGAATAYTADNTNGWRLQGGIATGTNNTWCTKVFARVNPTSTTLTPSFTTAGSVKCRVWLINVRTKIPKTTNNKSFLFSNQANTTNFSDSRFKYYNSNTNVLRIDSGVATANGTTSPFGPFGETRVMDLNAVFSSGTIGSKLTIKGAKGVSIGGDELSPTILVNVGANAWKGYVARYINGYNRLMRIDNAANSYQSTTSLTFGPDGGAVADGDIVELTYTPANGKLSLWQNGQLLQSATDTTYTSNLSPGFVIYWGNNGATGVTDYTPTGNVTMYCVGQTAANTDGTPTSVFNSSGDIGWYQNGYTANQTGKITQATIGISGWLGSTALKIIPYDSSLNRIGTSVATFTSSQGTGILTASFDTPFDVIKGKTYYIGIAPNAYVSLLGSAASTQYFAYQAGGYSSIPSTLVSGGNGPAAAPTVFLSGYPIPAAMSIQANTAVKLINLVETPSLSATYDFAEADGTKLTTINPAFYGQYVSLLQTLSGNLITTSTGGTIKAVYGKGFKADQSSQVTKTNSINTSRWVSIHSNTQQTDDGYSLYIRAYPSGAELYRAGGWVAGPYTVSSNAMSNTATAKIESVAQANGSLVINSYYNGSLIGSYTDLYPLSVGKPAIWISTTTAASDDAIGQFVAGGEAPKSQLYANGTFVVGEYIEN